MPQQIKKFSIRKALFVYGSALITNIMWVFCLRRINGGEPIAAAASNFFLALLSIFVVRSYVENWMYGISATLGFSTGTFFAVYLDTHHWFLK